MPHAAAGIDQNSDTERHAQIVRKKRNLLLQAVLEHLKIFEFQTIHVLAGLIEHRGGHIDELDLDIQLVARILRISGSRLWSRRFLRKNDRSPRTRHDQNNECCQPNVFSCVHSFVLGSGLTPLLYLGATRDFKEKRENPGETGDFEFFEFFRVTIQLVYERACKHKGTKKAGIKIAFWLPAFSVPLCLRAFVLNVLNNYFFFEFSVVAKTRNHRSHRDFSPLMRFAGDVPVPVRDFDHEVPCAVGYALAAQAAVWGQAGGEVELVGFRVAHFGKRLDAFADDAVTCRAGAYAAAGMVHVDAMRQRDVEDAAGQAGVAVRDLLRVDLHRHIHRKEGDRKFLRRRSRRLIFDVWICAAHINRW